MNQEQIQNIHAAISEVKVIDIKSLYSKVTNDQVIKKEFIENESRVYNQALAHNIWLKEIEAIKWKYPNENKTIWDYRNKNKRQFTKEISRKIQQGIISIINQQEIEVVSNNEKFNTWLNSNPFKFGASTYDFKTWSITYAFNYALIDPNAILIPYPIFRGEFEVIGIDPQIIPHDKRYIDPKGEFFLILDSQSRSYWAVDKQDWFFVDMSGQTPVWTLVYNHKTGELPFEYLPGLNSFDKNTRDLYFESLIGSVYDLCDEALVSFTADQAIRLKLNPILMRPAVRCETCNGSGIVKKDSKEVNCHTCEGTKIAPNLSELEDVVIMPTDWIQGENPKIPIEPKYIFPDVSLAEFSGKTWKEYFQLAKDGVGIDSLIKLNESGEAMKQRLLTFQEFLGSVLFWGYTMRFTNFFKICHKFLESRNPENWKEFPTIKIPKRVEIKTPELLKINLDNSDGGEKIQTAREYYNALYADNPNMQRTMRLIIDNYPAFLEKTADYPVLIQNQVFSSQDFQKSKFVQQVISDIIEKQGTANKSDETIISETEAILVSKIKDRIPIII